MSIGNGKRGRAGKGAVLIIATLLITSAVLRLITGAGTAIAEAVSTAEKPISTAADPFDPDDLEFGKGPTSKPRNRAEMGNLLEALQKREAQLLDRQRKMQLREKTLEIANKEISERMLDLEQLEVRLRQTLSLADGAAEGDLAQLTTVYENMKPKDAAALFEAMDPPFAAGFLGRMRPDTAAAIMAGLAPEVAYTISVLLAGRNANAPKS